MTVSARIGGSRNESPSSNWSNAGTEPYAARLDTGRDAGDDARGGCRLPCRDGRPDALPACKPGAPGCCWRTDAAATVFPVEALTAGADSICTGREGVAVFCSGRQSVLLYATRRWFTAPGSSGYAAVGRCRAASRDRPRYAGGGPAKGFVVRFLVEPPPAEQYRRSWRLKKL